VALLEACLKVSSRTLKLKPGWKLVVFWKRGSSIGVVYILDCGSVGTWSDPVLSEVVHLVGQIELACDIRQSDGPKMLLNI
jgi:hypothetical protein